MKRFSDLNMDAFLRAYPVPGFKGVDVLARALKDEKSFNAEIFPIYCETRDVGLRNALVEVNLPFARYMASRYCNPYSVAFDEYFSEAYTTLLKCVRFYDPAGGASFSTYAGKSIMNAFRTLSKRRNTIHIPQDLFEFLSYSDVEEESGFKTRVREARQALKITRFGRTVNKDRLRNAIGQSTWENGNYSDKQVGQYITSKEAEPLLLLQRKETSELFSGILSLTDKGRILQRHFYDNVTYKSVADSKGVTRSMISSNAGRNLDVLRKLFKGFEYHEGVLVEKEEPNEIVVCQEFNELRKFAMMLRHMGDYSARFASDISELETMARAGTSLFLLDMNMFDNLKKAIGLVREKNGRAPIILTYRADFDRPDLPKIRDPAASFCNVSTLSDEDHPWRLELEIRKYLGPSKTEIVSSKEMVSELIRLLGRRNGR